MQLRCTTGLELAMNFKEENIKMRNAEMLNAHSIWPSKSLLGIYPRVFLHKHQTCVQRCSLWLWHNHRKGSIGMGLVKFRYIRTNTMQSLKKGLRQLCIYWWGKKIAWHNKWEEKGVKEYVHCTSTVVSVSVQDWFWDPQVYQYPRVLKSHSQPWGTHVYEKPSSQVSHATNTAFSICDWLQMWDPQIQKAAYIYFLKKNLRIKAPAHSHVVQGSSVFV